MITKYNRDTKQGYIILICLAILALSSSITIFQVIGVIVLLFCALAISFELYERFSPKQKAIREKIDKSQKRSQQIEISAIRRKNKKRDDDIATFKEKYGTLTKQVLFPVNYDDDLLTRCKNLGILAENNIATEDKVTNDEIWNCSNRPFLVFEDASVLVIDDKVYPFTDILSFTLTDNEKTIVSESKSETKTDTGNMIGRAVIGGIALGGVGAIIGGTTAKSRTITSEYETSKSHDYVVSVIVNSLSKPVIQMKLYSDTKKVQIITSILSVIIHRNNLSSN